jgi:hypothetical protein
MKTITVAVVTFLWAYMALTQERPVPSAFTLSLREKHLQDVEEMKTILLQPEFQSLPQEVALPEVESAPMEKSNTAPPQKAAIMPPQFDDDMEENPEQEEEKGPPPGEDYLSKQKEGEKDHHELIEESLEQRLSAPQRETPYNFDNRSTNE